MWLHFLLVEQLESQLETAEANLKTLQGSHKDSITNSHSLESTLQQTQAELRQTAAEKQIATQKLAAIEEEHKKIKKKSVSKTYLMLKVNQ